MPSSPTSGSYPSNLVKYVVYVGVDAHALEEPAVEVEVVAEGDVLDAQERAVLKEVIRQPVLPGVVQPREIVGRIVRSPPLGLDARAERIVVVQHVVAVDAVEEYGEVEVLPAQREVQAGREVGIGVTDDAPVLRRDGVVARQVYVFQPVRSTYFSSPGRSFSPSGSMNPGSCPS